MQWAKERLRLCRAIYSDPETPWYARAVLWLTLAYALAPIDIIPDFIPVLGYLDDLLIVPLGIWLALKLVPRRVYERHIASLKGPMPAP